MTIRKRIASERGSRCIYRASKLEEVMDADHGWQATPAQIGSLLTALRMKGETVDEIAGFAESMRAQIAAG